MIKNPSHLKKQQPEILQECRSNSMFLVFVSFSIHNLYSAYTQLLALLSVSYSQTIKLLTVWLIVPQYDFGGIQEGSAEFVSEV